MDSKEMYRKKFEELLKIEEKARDLYKYYISQVEDPVILEKLKELYEDEQKHVKIVEDFIERAR